MLFKKVFIFLFLILSFIIFSQDAFAVCNRAVSPYCTFGAVVLTGGGTGALDKINGNDIAAGDIAITVTSTNRYFHTAKTSGCGAESPPDTIIPDTNPGTKCWARVTDPNLEDFDLDQLKNVAAMTESEGQILYSGPTTPLWKNTSILSINDVESRVGIGTTTPATKLDVAGVTTSDNFISDVAIGTQPYACTSTTLNTNLNADLWDGYQFADYFNQTYLTTSSPQFANLVITAGGDIRPCAISKTPFNTAQGDGTDFVTFDTTNKRVGFNNPPAAILNLKGALNTAITGTVSVSAGAAAVTGVGTSFTTALVIGDSIKIADEIFTVSVITNNTSLTLDSNHIAGASGVTAYIDPDLFLIENGDAVDTFRMSKSGNIGLGVSPSNLISFYAYKTHNTASSIQGIRSIVINNGTGVNYGLNALADSNTTGNPALIIGGYYQANQSGSGTIATLIGIRALTQMGGTGLVTNNIPLQIYGQLGSGQTTNAQGIYVKDFIGTVGKATNQYGIYLEKQTKGGTINTGIALVGDGLGADLGLGAGQNAKIYYDATIPALVLDPDVVGTGAVKINGKTIFDDTARLKGYTVATLPAGTQGDIVFVTDALTPTYLATVVGGGAVVTPVFYNGTNWV